MQRKFGLTPSTLMVRDRFAFCFNWMLLLTFLAGAPSKPGWAQNQKPSTGTSIVDKKTSETPSGRVTTGRFRVFENRHARVGRQIHLDFIILHARSETPQSDPLFFIVGGPGQAATTTQRRWERHWIRQDRDVVLIDQRGTGGDNYLQFEFEATDNSLQQYLDSMWDEEVVISNRDRLSKTHDLSMYSSEMAADDLNDFRQAIGYDQINLSGGSYGTRAILVYLRRHGSTVRTAMLSGCAPIEFRNPLYHAEGAQRCMDLIFDEVESNPNYVEAFGDLRKKFQAITDRLGQSPAAVNITNQSTGESESVQLTKEQFLAAVRFQTYYTIRSRQLPRLLCQAFEGNYRPFVLSALRQNIALRRSLAQGMLLSVTTAEDLNRINVEEIEPLTKNTYLGPNRVKAQMAAGKIWPKSKLDPAYGQPVNSNAPMLIFSGTLDPVTPPKWGELVHQNCPNSVHVVVPTAHDVGGKCVDQIKRQFLESGSVVGLDVDCVKQMKLPPLVTR